MILKCYLGHRAYVKGTKAFGQVVEAFCTFHVGAVTYVKGTKAFGQVVEAFGDDVVGEDGEINRRVLGPKVFADKV